MTEKFFLLNHNNLNNLRNFGVGQFLIDNVNCITFNNNTWYIKSLTVKNLVIIERLEEEHADIKNTIEKIIKHRVLRNKKTKIIFDRSYENLIEIEYILKKYSYYTHLGITENNFLFFMNSNFINYTNEKISHHKNEKIYNLIKNNVILGIDWCVTNAYDRCVNFNHPISCKKTIERPNKVNLLLGFINKNPRNYILSTFYKENLFDKTLLGLLSTNKIVETIFKDDKNLCDFLKNKIGSPDNVNIQIHQNNIGGDLPKISSDGWSKNSFVYDNSCLSFIAETWISTESKWFVTEKTYRPILNKHPFLLVGPQGMLKHLRGLGFITFDSIINENYDDLEDTYERVNCTVKETVKFLEICKNKFSEIDEIVNYNYSHFIKYGLSEIEVTKNKLANFLSS